MNNSHLDEAINIIESFIIPFNDPILVSDANNTPQTLTVSKAYATGINPLSGLITKTKANLPENNKNTATEGKAEVSTGKETEDSPSNSTIETHSGSPEMFEFPTTNREAAIDNGEVDGSIAPINEDMLSNIIKNTTTQEEQNLYYHINKSLLNAEYLFIEDYSKKIDSTISKIDNDEIRIKEIPRFIRDFIILGSSIKALCWRIKSAIEQCNKRRIEIETHPEEYANRIIKSLNIEEVSTDNGDVLYHFTQSVIEMTAIDHIYKVHSDNIGKLTTLWHRIEDIDGIGNDSFRDIVKMVKVKTASLLSKMVFDFDNKELIGLNSVEFFFSTEKACEADLKETISKFKLIAGLNQTINIKSENQDKKIESNLLPSNISDSDFFTCTDIKDYNRWITKGQNYYCENSKLISTIKEFYKTNCDLDETINAISNFYKGEKAALLEQFSPYCFLTILDFIKNQFESLDGIENLDDNEIKKYRRLLDLLQKTLNYLKEYLETFGNRMPPVFRPYFENSFYTFDKNLNQFTSFKYSQDDAKKWKSITTYDCDDFKDSFFFASYYCNAININRLKEKYEEYILFQNAFSSQIALKFFNSQSVGIQKTIKDKEENFNKIIDEQRREIKIQKEEIEKSRHSSLQILGLFTAFLSIIVSSIGTFRVASNISEYILYSLTYTLAIALFAFLISDRHEANYTEIENSNGKDEKKENDNENSSGKDQTQKSHSRLLTSINKIISIKKSIAFLLTFLALVIFAIFYFTNHPASENKTSDKEGASIFIDNSSTTNAFEENKKGVVPLKNDTCTFPKTHLQP